MPSSEDFNAAHQRLALLERHVEQQDAEIWRLTQRLDQLTAYLRQQQAALEEISGRTGGEIAPANEKPPHY